MKNRQQAKQDNPRPTSTTYEKQEQKYTGDKKLGGPNRPAE